MQSPTYFPAVVSPANSIAQTPSWVADSHSAGQQITRFLWNVKPRFHIHKSQRNPAYNLRFYFCKIRRKSLPSRLRPGLPNGLFPSGLTTKTLHALLTSLMRSTCPTPSIILQLNTMYFIAIFSIIETNQKCAKAEKKTVTLCVLFLTCCRCW